MEMRKLSATDLFPLLNIMAKIGIKDLIQEFFKQRSETAKKMKENKEVDTELLGMNLLAQITELVFLNIGRARNEINILLASLCGVKKEEIDNLSMSEYMKLVMDFLSQPEFKASLNVIMSSFK